MHFLYISIFKIVAPSIISTIINIRRVSESVEYFAFSVCLSALNQGIKFF